MDLGGSVKLGWLAVALASAAVPAALWHATTERHTLAAARALRGIAGPGDVVAIDATLAGARPDPAGLMRPFGALAPVVLDPRDALPDFGTFPAGRVFVVGALAPARLGIVSPEPVAEGVVSARPDRSGKLLVDLAGQLQVSVEQGGQERRCQGPHASGGVKCGPQPWQYVGPVVVRAPERLVACLWAHPFHQHSLRIDVPPQGASRARLWLQFADEAMRDGPMPAVTLVAESGGGVLKTVACHNRAEAGRCALDVDLPAAVSGGTPWLRLGLSTPDAARQLLCLGGAFEPLP